MARPKKMTEEHRAVLARRLKHAREVKARSRRVAEYMKGIIGRQPELRAPEKARQAEDRRSGHS